MEPLLKAEHVSKAYTGHVALDDVSLEIEPGKIHGLLGPNGAGKTTLIRIINRITAPDSGSVYFDGEPLSTAHISQIGYLPEERGLYKKMKVGDQALFFARLKGIPAKEARSSLEAWFAKLDISSWWDRKVEELSKGMAQKVQFIVTVLHRPRLLIFDEPFSGFDPINADILKREILDLRDQGATIIFSTHNMGSVEELCDEITLINRSRNILSGPVGRIREQFAGNDWEMAFVGDPENLQRALANENLTLGAIDSQGYATATVSLPPGADSRAFIAAANGAVDLRSIRRVIPNMNDIFIRAVNGNMEDETGNLKTDN